MGDVPKSTGESEGEKLKKRGGFGVGFGKGGRQG